MNTKIANLIYVIMIIVVITALIWMVFWLKSESSECVKNPINYFKDKNPEIDCYCSKDGMRIEELSDEIKYQP